MRSALANRLPLRVLSQPNRGRFEARKAGLNAARGEWVLLLDGRVRLRPGGLEFVRAQLESGAGASVWNGHVHVDSHDNPYGAFGDVLVSVAWKRYFDNPKTTSYGLEDFDHYPKGTGCFLAPRNVLLEALASFETSYTTSRSASDDTKLIRAIAAGRRINVSPSFACDYVPRDTLSAFVRNGVYRGATFLDGHGHRDSRFFPVILAFYPISVALLLVSIRRPKVAVVFVAATVGTAAAVAVRARRSLFQIASFAVLTPVYAVAHGIGMWRGLAMLLARRS